MSRRDRQRATVLNSVQVAMRWWEAGTGVMEYEGKFYAIVDGRLAGVWSKHRWARAAIRRRKRDDAGADG